MYWNLSQRQIQILDLLVTGLDDRSISERLSISKSTVKNTLVLIRLKTRTRSRVELAVSYALHTKERLSGPPSSA